MMGSTVQLETGSRNGTQDRVRVALVGRGGAMPRSAYGIIGVLVALILLFVLLRLLGVV